MDDMWAKIENELNSELARASGERLTVVMAMARLMFYAMVIIHEGFGEYIADLINGAHISCGHELPSVPKNKLN